jgi:hypothetical protein
VVSTLTLFLARQDEARTAAAFRCFDAASLLQILTTIYTLYLPYLIERMLITQIRNCFFNHPISHIGPPSPPSSHHPFYIPDNLSSHTLHRPGIENQRLRRSEFSHAIGSVTQKVSRLKFPHTSQKSRCVKTYAPNISPHFLRYFACFSTVNHFQTTSFIL